MAIFGDNTTDATAVAVGESQLYLRQFTASGGGAITKLHIWMGGTAGSQSVRLAVYSDNGSNYPGTPIDYSAQFTVSGGQTAFGADPALGASIVKGTKYWLGVWGGAVTGAQPNLYLHDANNTATDYRGSVTYAATGAPPTFPASQTSRNYELSVWLEYASAPVITSIGTSTGPAAGGTEVAIIGTGFTGASAVHFGVTNAPTYSVDSDTQITAVSPAHAAGVVDITVTTAAGTSATGAADEFTYADASFVPRMPMAVWE